MKPPVPGSRRPWTTAAFAAALVLAAAGARGGSEKSSSEAGGGAAATASPAAGKAVDGAGEAALPPGEYLCYTYHPRPVLVGSFHITGRAYRTPTGTSGRYYLKPEGRVDWLGKPPLGFAAGVLEELEPKAKIRMYPTAADIGNKWKAAVCTLREGGAATASRNEGAGAGTGGKFAAGSHVEMEFGGYWYPATVVRCSGERCLLHYDDPKWKDEWVDTPRIRKK